MSDQDQSVSEKKNNPWLSITRWLVVINIVVFVLDWFVIRRGYVIDLKYPLTLLATYGHFSFDTVFNKLQLWRVITYQFCHANIEHIMVNMFGLMLAGPIVEERMGRGKYLIFYLLCGIAGPVAHVVLVYFGVLDVGQYTPLIGASASIYGVLIAAATIAPDEPVEITFPAIEMKLRTLAIIMLGLSTAAVVWNWSNKGGHAAHLGGAVVGWILSREYRNKNHVVQ